MFDRKIQSPEQVPVQINVRVTWEYREHLRKIAEERHVGVGQLTRDTLETCYPLHRGEYDAGPTQPRSA